MSSRQWLANPAILPFITIITLFGGAALIAWIHWTLSPPDSATMTMSMVAGALIMISAMVTTLTIRTIAFQMAPTIKIEEDLFADAGIVGVSMSNISGGPSVEPRIVFEAVLPLPASTGDRLIMASAAETLGSLVCPMRRPSPRSVIPIPSRVWQVLQERPESRLEVTVIRVDWLVNHRSLVPATFTREQIDSAKAKLAERGRDDQSDLERVPFETEDAV